MRAVRTLVLGATLTLAGCMMIPRYQRPAAPVPERFPDQQDASTLSGAEQSWRSFVGDERLRRLIELALLNNRDLRIAVLNVEQARAQYRITRSASYPTVEATGGLSKQRALGVTTSEWSASLGVNAYELDLFGRVRSLNQQALESYFATEEAQRGAQVLLVAEVATQYFALREAEEQMRVAHDTLEAVSQSYQLNKIRFDAGESNELDLRTAEGQVQSARFDVLGYQRQVSQERDALELLLGQPLPSDLPAAHAFDEEGLLAPVPAGLPSGLIARRPDILEAEHTLKAANANIGAARAAFFPTISLTGSVGAASTDLTHLFAAGSGAWSFSPQISLPIFTAGQTRAQLESARISERIDVASYEKSIQSAFREVADALAAVQTYAQQVQVESTAIAAEQRRLELATVRYRQGEDNYLNVLSAQQDLYTAQQGRLQAQYGRLSSQISLYQSLGGGWQ
jgi:multidrug efflux system outer membrane protein